MSAMAGTYKQLIIKLCEIKENVVKSRKKLVLKNGFIGLISQGSSLILQLISRRAFIQFIGVEILGINNTFISLLQTLSLAELGFQSAIVYRLYQPIHDDNKEDINDIVNIYKIVYRSIGIFFVVLIFASLPFLKFILTNVTFDNRIFVYFILQASASTCTYFLAYKRTLLYADQKEYVYKSVDMVANIVFKSLQILTIVYLHNYIIYLLLQLIQAYSSNIVVHLLCKKRYPYLHKEPLNLARLKSIASDVKQVFAGRMAGYVYSCTDNLVISIVISTVTVGIFNNYTTITNNLKYLTASFMSPIAPIIGNYLIDDDSNQNREYTFKLYTHVRLLFALLIIIPMMVLIDDFIILWVGQAYVLSYWIKVLLAVDLFMYLMQGPCSDYITGSGLFKYDKNVQILGMILNIGISVTLAHFIGVEGVLIGTIISQLSNWIGRSLITYKYCLNLERIQFLRYWRKNVIYFITLIVINYVCCLLYARFPVQLSVGKFILSGIVCEIVIIVLYLLLYGKSNEGKKLIALATTTIRKYYKRM